MKHIEFICVCNKGCIRHENQDNFLVDKHYLEAQNDGLNYPLEGLVSVEGNPLFAVFDGMGGASCGEIAAYISADTLYKSDSEYKIDSEDLLNTAYMQMNRNVCDYMTKNRISSMGSTASVLLFKNNEYIVSNLGDSPVFRFANDRLIKISSEHTDTESYPGSKPGLTQYVGIPEEEFIIEPYFKTDSLDVGDRFLLCSDGLTDMVSNLEIGNILGESDIKTSAQKLVDAALENGGKDNITVVLCEIRGEEV